MHLSRDLSPQIVVVLGVVLVVILVVVLVVVLVMVFGDGFGGGFSPPSRPKQPLKERQMTNILTPTGTTMTNLYWTGPPGNNLPPRPVNRRRPAQFIPLAVSRPKRPISRPWPGKKKRKAEEDLSTSPNTIRVRKRKGNIPEDDKRVETATTRLNTAISRTCKKMRESDEWKLAGDDEREEIDRRVRSEIDDAR